MPPEPVKCRHCGKERFEDEMGIYAVDLDEYFCDQECLDLEYTGEKYWDEIVR